MQNCDNQPRNDSGFRLCNENSPIGAGYATRHKTTCNPEPKVVFNNGGGVVATQPIKSTPVDTKICAKTDPTLCCKSDKDANCLKEKCKNDTFNKEYETICKNYITDTSLCATVDNEAMCCESDQNLDCLKEKCQHKQFAQKYMDTCRNHGWLCKKDKGKYTTDCCYWEDEKCLAKNCLDEIFANEHKAECKDVFACSVDQHIFGTTIASEENAKKLVALYLSYKKCTQTMLSQDEIQITHEDYSSDPYIVSVDWNGEPLQFNFQLAFYSEIAHTADEYKKSLIEALGFMYTGKSCEYIEKPQYYACPNTNCFFIEKSLQEHFKDINASASVQRTLDGQQKCIIRF